MGGYSHPIKVFHALGQLIRHRLPKQVSLFNKKYLNSNYVPQNEQCFLIFNLLLFKIETFVNIVVNLYFTNVFKFLSFRTNC